MKHTMHTASQFSTQPKTMASITSSSSSPSSHMPALLLPFTTQQPTSHNPSHATASYLIFATHFSYKPHNFHCQAQNPRWVHTNCMCFSIQTDQTVVGLWDKSEHSVHKHSRNEEYKNSLSFCFSCEPLIEARLLCISLYGVLFGVWASIKSTQNCIPLGASRVIEAGLLTIGSNKIVRSRRALIAMAALWFPCKQAIAAASVKEEPSLGDYLLRSFGVGDTDIYYPNVFEGTWDCYSRLVDVETPQGEEKADAKSLDFSRKQLGYIVKYHARFIPYNGKVIGDRLFTTMSLVESTLGKDVVTRGIWSPQHPNRLILMLRGEIKVENLVTKSSSKMSTFGSFDTSEYSKQVFDNASFMNGPPLVKASQNITRYRWDPAINQVMTIEAFQRVAIFPVPGDKFEDLLDSRLSTPVTVYKYVVQFTRALDSS